eukprot:2450606-Rhodomonas_salina.1
MLSSRAAGAAGVDARPPRLRAMQLLKLAGVLLRGNSSGTCVPERRAGRRHVEIAVVVGVNLHLRGVGEPQLLSHLPPSSTCSPGTRQPSPHQTLSPSPHQTSAILQNRCTLGEFIEGPAARPGLGLGFRS